MLLDTDKGLNTYQCPNPWPPAMQTLTTSIAVLHVRGFRGSMHKAFINA